MPLLKRHPFVRNPHPEDLKLNEEVFFCPLTKEVFREYDAFFNRTILLNSLVWSCSVTGRSGLTFEEALESEKHAQESLDSFPESLEKPLAYVVEMTYRGRMDDLVSDVWTFMKDRFFINEEVEVFNKKSRRLARIIGVKYSGNPAEAIEKEPKKEEESNLNGSSNESIEVQKSAKRLKEDLKAPSPSCYTYDIEYIPEDESDEEEEEAATTHEEDVKHSTIFRKKGTVTKGKLKLFIKNACEPHESRWGLKAHLLREYDVETTGWEDIFTGPKPVFPRTPMAKRAAGTVKHEKVKKDQTENGYSEPSTSKDTPDSNKEKGKGNKEKKPKKLSKAELKRQEEQKKKEEEDKKVKKKQDEERIGLLDQAKAAFGQNPPSVDLSPWEKSNKIFTFDEMFALRMAVRKAKQHEKERVQEEKRREREVLLEWKRQRDDLECDDLKPLPVPPALRLPSWISNESFGEILSLLEFFRCFEDLLGFADGLSVGLVELDDLLQVLVSREGPRNLFLELLTVLLEVWGMKQTEEDGDEANMENDQQVDNSELEHPLYSEDIQTATRVSEEIRIVHGVSIRKLQLDPLTITEVLRLYIVAGGYYTGQSTAKFRYHNRGGYRCWDDQCFMFRLNNPDLVKRLQTQSVLDFDPVERLKILCLIRDQLLTFFAFREHHENNLESFRQLRVQMRILEKNDEKAEKEAKAARTEIRYIERLTEARAEAEEDAPKDRKKEASPDDEIPKRPKPSKKSLKLSKWLQNHFQSDGDTFSLAPTRKGADAEAEMHQLMNDGVEFREMSELEIGQVRQLQRAKLVADQEEVAENLLLLNVSTGLTFLGRDRAFRRYWYSHCLSTVFMEENDDTIGTCGEATSMSRVPNRPDLDDLPLSQFNPDAIDAKLRTETLACTGDESSCLVHGQARTSRPVWSVFQSIDQLNELSKAMNERGFREMELAENIRALRSHLEKAVTNEHLNPKEDGSGGLFGSYFNYDPNSELTGPQAPLPPDWSFLLRDLLLETEEKIHLGGLGALQIPNRLAWRESLMNNPRFDPQIERLTVGNAETVLKSMDASEISKLSDVSLAGLALVQIAQGVNLKFLKDPFVEENKDNAENGPTLVGQRVATMSFFLWQRSAVESSSFFQVAVHLSSLEPCISWKQSKLQARCRICRKKGSSDTTVLCDSCDKAFHIFCARPKLKQVPTENWLCCDCVKIERERREREEKNRKMEERRQKEADGASEASSDIFDNEISGDESEEACIECGKTATARSRAECEECGLVIHYKCAGLKARPKAENWLCTECRGGESSTDEDIDEYTEKVVTSKTGRVIKKTKSYNEEVLATSNRGKTSSRRSSGRNSPVSMSNGYGHTNGAHRKRKNASDIKQDLSEEDLRSLSMGLRRKGLGKDEYTKCQKVIEETRKQEDAIPFLTPVDKKEVPLYYTFIKTPMDLRKMLNKLKQHQYECVEDVVADATLMFKNCRAFNEEYADVYQCGTRLEEFMMKQFRSNGLIDDSNPAEKRRRSGVSK